MKKKHLLFVFFLVFFALAFIQFSSVEDESPKTPKPAVLTEKKRGNGAVKEPKPVEGLKEGPLEPPKAKRLVAAKCIIESCSG